MPERPGLAAAHQRKHDRESRKLAESYGSPAPAAPLAPAIELPVPRREPEGVRTVTTITASGAKLETFVGWEPRTDVEAVQPGRHRAEAERHRMQTANRRWNRSCRHLFGPLD